ncbi:sugar ABC transporter ATP-binding protein [Herbiconiux flava]|uniref:Ribose transport system ATP-binding protein n=1 Tax=Herbiconiux flava TaxID=881268 RepID=A0A852SL15_9MICO|nr:sugar ABC transporter ATP-binding protein [Herbiconiux flava]NYD69301.1 ribose transport system ATP-binding protein [Herbiconiux flava]GLK16047.1 ABC transporter permease [Herbiconiux flava]
MTVPALQALAISKSFPGVKALDEVSLTLLPGSVHALLGENGAGKSTLIKALTGVHRPDGGRILVAGRDGRAVETSLADPAAARDAGIGVVHQERNVIRGFSVAENIVLGRMPLRGGRIDWTRVHDEAAACLAQLEVALDPATPIAELSSAQMQLVEIARALYTETRVLLLDEPTASISGAESDRLFRVVDRLRDEGAAVLFVSHKLEEVYAHCDTVTVLRDGRSVLESQPLAAHSHDEIVDTMVGRALGSLTVPARAAPRSEAPALELSSVTTTAGHHGVSLRVRPGEILGLYGLVGAGRTELARAIVGLERITAGELRVEGVPARIRSVRQALHRHRIGYVTENRKEEGVFLEQSITRNIAVTVWPELQRGPGLISARRERELVARFVDDLDIRISSQAQLAGRLSGGNQQKVSLAKWLAASPRILIIDEPTVGIDLRTKRSFYELIWKLADEGMAILLISSDLAEMITLADRIAVMDRFVITGERENSHEYDSMSQEIIRLIHSHSAEAGPIGESVAGAVTEEEGIDVAG